MNTITAAKHIFASFICEEEGAQVVEYGLIIAVVSIALVVALSTLAGDGTTAGPFSEFIDRVEKCLTDTAVGACE